MRKLLGFYGCARKHRIQGHDIITLDIDERYLCNITDDVCAYLHDGKLENYDYLIFTPPCNYFSKANYRREESMYALSTRHILYDVLEYCVAQEKPFIVENVLNQSYFGELYKEYQFYFGGHTFWSNLMSQDDVSDLIPVKQNKQNVCQNKRDGNKNVDMVLKRFIGIVEERR